MRNERKPTKDEWEGEGKGSAGQAGTQRITMNSALQQTQDGPLFKGGPTGFGWMGRETGPQGQTEAAGWKECAGFPHPSREQQGAKGLLPGWPLARSLASVPLFCEMALAAMLEDELSSHT